MKRSAIPEILTRAEVAAWLKVRPRQVDRLGVPCIKLGHKTTRYVRDDVIEWLKQWRAAVRQDAPS